MVGAALKLISVVFLIVTYAASGASIRLLRRDHRARRRALARLTQFYARLCVRIFGVTIELEGVEHLERGGRAPLILANHLSYLDVILLSSIHPAVFVTSREVRDTPFLGLMAKSGGSVFVERRSKWGLAKELEEINEVLESGTPVVIFPEGTTSNGDGVLPFKSALLSCAESSGTEIVPACIRYHELEGKPINAGNRDKLYYYDDIQFFPHFMGMMAVRSFKVRLRFLPPVGGSATPGLRRKELADRIRQSILEIYNSSIRRGGACPGIQEQTVLN